MFADQVKRRPCRCGGGQRLLRAMWLCQIDLRSPSLTCRVPRPLNSERHSRLSRRDAMLLCSDGVVFCLTPSTNSGRGRECRVKGAGAGSPGPILLRFPPRGSTAPNAQGRERENDEIEVAKRASQQPALNRHIDLEPCGRRIRQNRTAR
jgi:hypothetical protein